MKVKKHLKRALPCPNCKSKYLFLRAYVNRAESKGRFFIKCYNCFVEGSSGKNVKEAVDLWNKERK